MTKFLGFERITLTFDLASLAEATYGQVVSPGDQGRPDIINMIH